MNQAPKPTMSRNPMAVAVARWFEKGATSQAAALTFFSLFAMGPVLTVSLALAADLLGDARAREDFEGFLNTFVSPEAASTLISVLERQDGPTLGSVFTVNGLLLLFGAGAFMRQLRRSMSGTALLDFSSKRKVIVGVVLNRITALVLVLVAIGGLATLSLATALLSGALGAVENRWKFPGWVFPTVDAASSWIVAALCFFVLYRFVPRPRPCTAAAGSSALLFSTAFVGGKSLLSLYLSRVPWGSTYGAAGSLAVTMLWLFFVCNLLLLGNEFAQELHRRQQPRDGQPGLTTLEVLS